MNSTRTMTSAAAVATVLLLSACAGPTQTTLSDGSIAYRIDCESSARGLNYCFERAGKSCGAQGFTIVDPEGRAITTSDVATTDAAAMVREYGRDASSILIKCGL